jgi:hypothetical protein
LIYTGKAGHISVEIDYKNIYFSINSHVCNLAEFLDAVDELYRVKVMEFCHSAEFDAWFESEKNLFIYQLNVQINVNEVSIVAECIQHGYDFIYDYRMYLKAIKDLKKSELIEFYEMYKHTQGGYCFVSNENACEIQEVFQKSKLCG